jgi:hypothetical protein
MAGPGGIVITSTTTTLGRFYPHDGTDMLDNNFMVLTIWSQV